MESIGVWLTWHDKRFKGLKACLTSWPRISTQDHREQIQQVARAGLEPRTAQLQVQPANHLAALTCFMMIIGGC